jgi:glycosyltransferase involved in cell wall biosynthesis
MDFQSRDPKRIRIFRHHVNQGILKNVNFLLEQAAGDYLTVLDADDFIHPTKLAKQVDAFVRNPKLAVSWSGVSLCDIEGNVIETSKSYPVKENEIRAFIDQKNAVPCGNVASMMYPLALYQKLGGYRPIFNQIGSWDIDFVLRLIEYGEISVIPESLYLWRKHPLSFSRKENFNPLRNQSHQIAHLLRRQRKARGGVDDLSSPASNSGEVDALILGIKKEYEQDPSKILREMAKSKDLPRQVRLSYAKRAILVNPYNWKNYKYFLKAIFRA